MGNLELMFELPKKGFTNESLFTTRFLKQIRQNGGFAYKLSDQSMDCKPFDAIACYKGKSYFIEFKIGEHKSHCNIIKLLQGNQEFSLNKVKDNGGLSLVIYYNKYYNEYFIYNYQHEINFNKSVS